MTVKKPVTVVGGTTLVTPASTTVEPGRVLRTVEMTTTVEAGTTLVWITVGPGSELTRTEVAMIVEAGKTAVEPGWVTVDAGTTMLVI